MQWPNEQAHTARPPLAEMQMLEMKHEYRALFESLSAGFQQAMDARDVRWGARGPQL
jgi:hypothetical protein